MRAMLIPAALATMVVGATISAPAQAGCLTGAAVGAVAGHFAGRHALLGAGAGCVVGRVNSNRRDERDRAYEPGNDYNPGGVSNYQRPSPYSGSGDPRAYNNDQRNYNNGYQG